ncbi:MAG: hydrogenase/urease maturation nickel metallochaperone HypA [archaeon]
MHDIAIIQGILDAVLERAKGRNLKLIELDIEIGALKFVEPENARFWLKEMLKKEFGPKLRAKISIKTIEPEIKCKCGFQGNAKEVHATHDMVHAGIFEMHCPKCNGHDFETVKGKEVLIRGMEFR